MHIIKMFDLCVRNDPEKLAFTGDGGDFTYREVEVITNRVARKILSRGMGKGTRFSVVSPNIGLAMSAVLGAIRANAVWCNVNLRETPETIIGIFKRGGVELVFYHSIVSSLISLANQQVESLKEAVCIDKPDDNGIYFWDWIEDVSDESRPTVSYEADDIIFQGCTGGTTGLPKLALFNRDYLMWNCLGFATSMHFKEPPVYLSVAPISHGGGMIALYTLTKSGTVVMIAKPELDNILEAIPKYNVSFVFLPPTLTYMLLKHPKTRGADFSTLRYFFSSAAPIAAERIAEGMEVFGPVMSQGYGQTEVGLPVTFISPDDYLEALTDESKRHRLASCGRQVMTIEALEIVDENDRPLGPNERGEIVIRAPSVMLRYLNDPEATETIQQNNWHHTGDIGYRDEDGYFYIVDRKRDMVISGGFNIYPFEIEGVLLGHPAVQDCAVIGVPDEKWGEAVKAVVVITPGKNTTEEELMEHCRSKLGGMKTPKTISFWDELPRSAAGKVLKRVIRDKYWETKDRKVH